MRCSINYLMIGFFGVYVERKIIIKGGYALGNDFFVFYRAFYSISSKERDN